MNFLETASAGISQTLMPELPHKKRELFRTPRTVLFAEDDNDLRYVMECSLRAMGYSVIPCADAHLASAAFRSNPFVDLLLTDFEMPTRSGLELARELTANCPSLPVVILTGSILSDATMQELRDRRWTYVSKPCQLAALAVTLQQMIKIPCAVQPQHT